MNELTPTAALLWEGRVAARRGPKPAMTLEQIAEAGVAIADEQGLDAVSMQAVADSLGFTKMSLYRYVAGKDELLAVMVEHAAGDPPALPARAGWRKQLGVWADALIESWLLHPWLPWATVGDRDMGPREVAWVECALRPLTRTRLTTSEQLDAVFLLFGHLRNTQSLTSAGTQPWHEPGVMAMLERHQDRYPALLGASAAKLSRDNGRAFGLACILDGIEAQHQGRG